MDPFRELERTREERDRAREETGNIRRDIELVTDIFAQRTSEIRAYLDSQEDLTVSTAEQSTHNVQDGEGDDLSLSMESQQLESIRGQFEKTKAQLVEKNEELVRVKRDLEGRNNEVSSQQTRVNHLTREKDQLRIQIQDLSNKNKKLTDANTQSRKQGNYASIFLVLSGVSAVCACLTTLQMEICILFASVAFIFLAAGCYCSYKANTALECVKIDQFIDNAANINA